MKYIKYLAAVSLSVLTLTLVNAGEKDAGEKGEIKDEMKVVYRSNSPYPNHGVTMAGALHKLGVTREKIDYLKLVGDEGSGTSGRSVKVKMDELFWGQYFQTAEPYKFRVASGYRCLEIYLKGESKPKATIRINETDSSFIDGDPSKLRYMCRGLDDWCMYTFKEAKNKAK